jgi:hypothetical protein
VYYILYEYIVCTVLVAIAARLNVSVGLGLKHVVRQVQAGRPATRSSNPPAIITLLLSLVMVKSREALLHRALYCSTSGTQEPPTFLTLVALQVQLQLIALVSRPCRYYNTLHWIIFNNLQFRPIELS